MVSRGNRKENCQSTLSQFVAFSFRKDLTNRGTINILLILHLQL